MATPLPLRVRGPAGGQPQLLADLTSESTLEELECDARIALGIEEDVPLALLAGFPPRPLAPAASGDGDGDGNADGGATTLGALGLRPNEVVTAKEETGGEATVLHGQGAMPGKRGGGKKKKKAASASASGGGAKRPAAAIVGGGGGANIHTLHDRRGGGDGGGGGGGGGGKRRRVQDMGVNSEEDIGALLLSAVGKGGGGGRVGACMRAVFRKAVEKQFDESKALARVAAMEAGPTHYEIEEAQGARRADGTAARLRVRYHKGLGFRSMHEDDVELLSKPQLAGIVMVVLADPGEGAREMLKPANMAGCSPRVFWSLVHHFGPDVEAGLKQLLPMHADWAFLDERARKLSEKALANKEQEAALRKEREELLKEKKAKREARLAAKMKTTEEGGKEGAKVVVDGGEEGGGGAAPALSESEKRAQAALARFGTGGGEQAGAGAAAAASAAAAAAGEEEEEEEEGEIDSDFPEIVTDAWVRVLRSPAFNIARCKHLAAAGAVALTARFQQHHARGAAPRPPSLPTEEEVAAWIDACREDELEEMMLAIVEMDEEVLEALELVHVAMPKDVALWGSVPQALLDTLARDLPGERWAQIEGRVSVERIQGMAATAKRLLETVAWVDDYWSK